MTQKRKRVKGRGLGLLKTRAIIEAAAAVGALGLAAGAAYSAHKLHKWDRRNRDIEKNRRETAALMDGVSVQRSTHGAGFRRRRRGRGLLTGLIGTFL